MQSRIAPRSLIFSAAAAQHTAPLQHPGSVDPGFPIIGMAPSTHSASRRNMLNAIAIQEDRSLVVAGGLIYSSLDSSVVVRRYTPDGEADESFGDKGVVTTAVGAASAAYGLVLQQDGKIVVAGNTYTNPVTDWIILRYNNDGTVDSGFGANGQVRISISDGTDQAFSVLQQPDGKLVVGGETWQANGDIQFAIGRLMPDGSLDQSFGSGGIATLQVGAGPFSGIRRVLLTQSGGIVAVGYGYRGNSNFTMGVARLNSEGALDASFGDGGTVSMPIENTSAYANDAALAGDKIVLAGVSLNRTTEVQNIALMRLEGNGDPDYTFGSGGVQVTALAGYSFSDGNGVEIQKDGRILLAAKLGNGPNDGSFSVLQYEPSGGLSESFGAQGVTITNFNELSVASALAIQGDGKVVLAGFASSGPEIFAAAMARYFF
jgi:uncharacterized delta-60 repeat protein